MAGDGEHRRRPERSAGNGGEVFVLSRPGGVAAVAGGTGFHCSWLPTCSGGHLLVILSSSVCPWPCRINNSWNRSMNSRERFQNAIISNHLKLATVEQQRAGEDVLKLVGEKKTKQRIQATGEQSAEMVTGEGAIYVTSNRGYNSKAAVQETVWATLNSFQYLQPLGAGRSGQGGAGRGWSSLTCSRGTPVAWSSPGAEARRPGAAGAPVVGWIAAGGGGGAATCGGGAR